MRGFSRTVQLALDIISTFASDMTRVSTPEEMATAYFQAIGGRDTQSLPEPIKSRTIRQIKKLSDPKVSELAIGILSNFSSSIANIFTTKELWDEYQKFVDIAKSLPEPINGETILALARIWFPKSNSESVRYNSFGKKLNSSQKTQIINFLQKLARYNNISIFKVRKDKKGYTKIPLIIPQLKSRLTRHGIRYKMKNKMNFGMPGSSRMTDRSYAQVAREANETERLGAPVRTLLERVLSRIEVPAQVTNQADLLEAYRLIRMFPSGSTESTQAQRNLDNAERRSRNAWREGLYTGIGGSGDRYVAIPRITSGRLPRFEMLRYNRNVNPNPRDITPTGEYQENYNYPTGYNIY